MELKKFIRDIPDFPEKGIIFRDITPLLKNPEAFNFAIDQLVNKLKEIEFNTIVAPEARGFIFGGALAYKLGKGLVPVRKPGKLPYKVISEKYSLEYGEAELQMHIDAISQGEKVIIFDDVLATGGTALALKKLVEKAGGEVVSMAFLIELTYLNPRKLLSKENIISLITY
ncbi:adenine phosphoribosyltransferase [Thermosipho melanesiensis]|uniref:Adenine phosphoribosyltransferase n=1 Tax=Thermosipho melanesiensis TaxID=46541 RepID=A0ABN4UXF4_9BACT|nr:adenine phosphoribosyltransferase [Thermosipho melanesiensis]APT74704.1 adenine phosphoribosyltransferase [Thermosipho melanesiensis]OOC35201.1 adenine phosphoribosyltransferase [Thermosipho melanesiensis]OOC35411.1 adenine phosphoribosyltransferase [Thermosipho melanesiensis]OOC36662.1 adenine phosphoribosyltransferase [Thermosipho melanesiensis]OOC39983.1 adenine phosphoribosyltransferase [Thermosipho melanesiensis]